MYKHYRTQHERRHLHQCTFDTCSVDGCPYGNDEQYTVWWHMQEDHGLQPPWVVLNVMAPSATNKASRNIYPPALAKKTNMAPNRCPMLRKGSNVTNVQRITPERLHYSSIRRCTKALTRSICAASVVKVSVQPQPCTDMKRYIKITEYIKKKQTKFQIPNLEYLVGLQIYQNCIFLGLFLQHFLLPSLPPLARAVLVYFSYMCFMHNPRGSAFHGLLLYH